MRSTQIVFLFIIIASFTSCLKAKNDFAGLRTDEGTIITSIAEKQYINVDVQNVQLGFSTNYANFSFTSPATESVKFLTLHISQPREKKLSGPLLVRMRMDTLTGYTFPPAGVITLPTEVSVPASTAAAFDYSVLLNVNKVGLNSALHYGARFTITGVNQGAYSELDKSINVGFNLDASYNTSRYTGRYQWTSTVVDAARQIGVTNNTKPVLLEENVTNRLDILDFFSGSAGLFANNLLTGSTATAIFSPRYVLDATGKVTSIINQSNTAAVTNIALDAAGSNQFTYTANNTRTMNVKYSFTLTTTINGVSTPRTVTVTDSYVYDLIQVQ